MWMWSGLQGIWQSGGIYEESNKNKTTASVPGKVFDWHASWTCSFDKETAYQLQVIKQFN